MRLSITSRSLPLQTYVRARVIPPAHVIVNEPRVRIRKDRRLNPSVLCCTDDVDRRYATPPFTVILQLPHLPSVITDDQ